MRKLGLLCLISLLIVSCCFAPLGAFATTENTSSPPAEEMEQDNPIIDEEASDLQEEPKDDAVADEGETFGAADAGQNDAGIAIVEEPPVVPEDTAKEPLKYYYDQLTVTAKSIYDKLSEMLASDEATVGKTTVDLVEEGIFANKYYSQEALMYEFISARDAFMLDHNVFYVDFDKMSLTYAEQNDTYSIKMGIGREANYLHDGFTTGIDTEVADFNAKVNEIVAAAEAKEGLKAQVKAAYDEVIRRVDYKLEKDADSANVLYVRDPYGALVRGQAVCEGYARALKAVLDKMGIDNVLVQGMYVDGEKLQPHMWNYVKMDDNRWYLLDATMGDADGQGGTSYFLKEEHPDVNVMNFYQPDGKVSLSDLSPEFRYPVLSSKAYEEMSTAFTVTKVEGEYYDRISYNGMGIAAAAEKDPPKYILGSFNGNVWYYAKNHLQYTYMTMQSLNTPPKWNEFTSQIDYENYFSNIQKYAYVAVTNTAPPSEDDFDRNNMNAYFTYTGGLANISDISKIGEPTELKKMPPTIVEKTQGNGMLKGNTTYEVEVVYSEDLKLENLANPAGIKWLSTQPTGSSIDTETKALWTADEPEKVRFTLKTSDVYGHMVKYYFELENLVGAETGGKPGAICYNVMNAPVFGCPKVDWSVSKIHSNTPALISNGDLSTTGWTYNDGTTVQSALPSRLALVATELPEAEKNEMIGEIKKELGTESVLASQTFDLSLTLCSGQVSYITGRKVQVFVPFPDGYNAESNVAFKAYHFKADGTPEEIDCVTTENGIIMMCDSFSPFAVVAVAKSEVADADRAVMVAVEGQGSVKQDEAIADLVKVSKNGKATLSVAADTGFVIDTVLLNGKALTVTEGAVEVAYDTLKDSGNVLEVSFIVEGVKEGTTPVDPDAPGEGEGTDPGDGGNQNPGDGEGGDNTPTTPPTTDPTPDTTPTTPGGSYYPPVVNKPADTEKPAEDDKEDVKADEEKAEEEAAAQAAKVEKIKKGVENTTLKAKSQLIRRANGKFAIKINWAKSKGYRVDYYEVHRSVKKNSGYGKKPFFTTDGDKRSYTNTKNVKPGKTYYFYVRGVRVIDGEKVYTEKSTKAYRTVK